MQKGRISNFGRFSFFAGSLHAKLSLFAYVISGERSANRPKQLRNDAFHVKASQSAKNKLNPAKNENRPKFDIRPFCTKPFHYYLK